MLGTGCSPISNLTHTMLIEPLQFCDFREEHRTHARHERLAESAWEEFPCYQNGECISPHFARGFKDGFADYLDAGGTGEPPPIPPRSYWRDTSESGGHQAIRDWFAGFRQGAAVARESGYRQFATISLSTSTDDHVWPERQPVAEPLPTPIEPLPLPLSRAGTWRGESPPLNGGPFP